MASPKYQANANSIEIKTANEIETLITATGTYGTLIQQVVIQANQDVTSGMIKFYIMIDIASETWQLIREVPVSEVISTNQYPAFSNIISFNDIVLPIEKKLGVSTVNSESFSITVFVLDVLDYV